MFVDFKSGTIKVLIGTLTAVGIMLIGSYYYYDKINSTEDPRVLKAKQLLLQYEKGLKSDQYVQAFSLLETILSIYKNTPGYADSYEVGVVLNNQASVHLVKLETDLLVQNQETINKEDMIKTLKAAMVLTKDSIEVYRNWMDSMGKLTEKEIRIHLGKSFDPEDMAFENVDFEAVFEKRVEDIKLAQIETERRLSVSLTNLGVINRYLGNLEEAKGNYEQALLLWDRNYTAKNNLNILMNRPLEKRSLIDRLFPPERLQELRDELKIKKPEGNFN
ncbi:MAG: hypothetical protein MJE63_07470 [Proteobacteria bacterium]|nr:hypothetical protein [Pseudomonadota bacterium]